jgi:5-methylcytosine-specific restriction endonuclease McrA
MKFELEPDRRNLTEQQLLDDLKEAAKKIGRNTITMAQYNHIGTYSSSTIQKRFGSWFKALKIAGLKRSRSFLSIKTDELLDDLRSVAKMLKLNSLTQQLYAEHGSIGPNTISRRFGGSWLKALKAAGLSQTRKYGLTDEEYFSNLEQIWRKLGRQLKYSEIRAPLSTLSAGAYERRFGSWRKALEAFISYINSGEDDTSDVTSDSIQSIAKDIEKTTIKAYSHKTSRPINLRLRFKVLRRDNFKCKICGKSPATHAGTILHVDHIKPWSKGGETTFENLQTLCETCNIGKGNLSQSDED